MGSGARDADGVVAGIDVIASVSAASSLAIDLADRAGAALLAVVRDGRMNVCCGDARVDRDEGTRAAR
jgi:FdhD protein